MKTLLIYIKEFKKESILAPLFKLLEATLELFVPLVVAAIIDNGISAQDTKYIIRMCLVLILLAAVGLAFSVTAQYFAARAAVGAAKNIRHALFLHIQEFSYADLDAQGTSSLITRMTSDINQVQTAVNITLRLLLRSPFIVAGAVVMAFTIDVRSAVVFAVGVPLLAVVIFAIMMASVPLYKKVQEKLDRVLSFTRENLSGNRVIRAFCREEDQKEKFHRIDQELTDTQLFVGRFSALLNPATFVIINLAVVVLIHTGAVRVNAGLLSQGSVVALYNYMAQIIAELIKFALFVINLNKGIACAGRIQAVLETKPSISYPETPGSGLSAEGKCEEKKSTSDPGRSIDRRIGPGRNAEPGYREKDAADTPLVEFVNAGMRYPEASEESISNISFKAYPGEVIGIIGGTGSGKSSLVNLIPRFYDCSSGAVFVGGMDVREHTKDGLRKRIGVVPQKAVLFEGTVRSNLCWGKGDACDEEMIEALKIAQAGWILDARDGLDEEVEQGGRNFSGGQRQRLTIARALVRKPQILILDDSSSALDLATDAALRKALGSLSYSPLIFVVSQRTSSIASADRIIVLDDGKAVGIGRHEALLESCDVYREIYESQFRRASCARGEVTA